MRSATSATPPGAASKAAPPHPEDCPALAPIQWRGWPFTIDGDGNVEAPRVVASDLLNAFERAALYQSRAGNSNPGRSAPRDHGALRPAVVLIAIRAEADCRVGD
ncbi:hypothetical protein, partial [Thermomonas sp.]|uniref:hypothetical protein n=1 Tax=Thermomonas sp. TaxID=1971895 RepID=UPI0025EBD17F